MSDEIATLGGGCFWCLEAVFKDLRGVTGVMSGYAGGQVANPSYKAVCAGTTGHAEVVQVKFDPAEVSYADLLRVFFTIHDPTTKDRQGHDVGPQYRSIILTHSDAQRETAAVGDQGDRRRQGLGRRRWSPRSSRCRCSTRPNPSITTISRAIPGPAIARRSWRRKYKVPQDLLRPAEARSGRSERIATMDLNFTDDERAFREEARRFFRTEVPQSIRDKVAKARG